jgi:anti-sigma factor RsiW
MTMSPDDSGTQQSGSPHDQWRIQLDTYLDGELPADQMRALDAHLRTCPACAADALARVQFKRAIKTAGVRFTPSVEFRERVQKKIAFKPRRSSRFSFALAGVFALLLIAGLLTAYVQRQNLLQRQFYGEIADLHVSTLASPNPVDVVSTDRHTVKPWFQGKIPFTFNLPELQNTDFTLVGGRVTYLGQVPGAHLIYQIRKHQISVFIFPEDLVSLRVGSSTAKERSFNLQTFTQEGLRYIVFGDVAADDIKKLSEMLQSAAKSS